MGVGGVEVSLWVGGMGNGWKGCVGYVPRQPWLRC